MQTLNRSTGTVTKDSVPNRPAISSVLVKASANVSFRNRLLSNPRDALAELNLPQEDAEVLADVQALTLKEYAQQVKMKLMVRQLGVVNPLR